MTDQTQFKEINPIIPVRHMPEAVAFYEEKLGFAKVFDDAPTPGEPFHYAGMRRGGLCLHLQSMASDENPTMPLLRIRVHHIEPLYEEYNAKGLVSSHLEAQPWGSRDFGVYDLNGAALVFYEDL